MLKGPLVSIIIPVYNTEEFVSESIQSILDQTYSNFELIIINDGSTDKTTEILEAFANKDKRIKIINNKKNLGIVLSMNKGLKIAKGKYIARFDADDVSYRNRIMVQQSYLENHPDVFQCSSDAVLIDRYGKIIGKTDYPFLTKKNLLDQNIILNTTTMFRNHFGYSYRPKFIPADDYDLWLRMLSDNRKMVILKKYLVKWRVLLSGVTLSNNEFPLLLRTAQSYYWERIKFGKDSYQSMKPIVFSPKGDANSVFAKKGYLWTLLNNNGQKRAKEFFHARFKLREVGIKYWLTYFIFIYLPFSLFILQNSVNRITKYRNQVRPSATNL